MATLALLAGVERWLGQLGVPASHRLAALAGDSGPRPVAWLGPETPFRGVAHVGRGPGLITIYARPRPEAPALGPGATSG